MARLNKDFRTVDGGMEIVADDASEIQPAIDEISETVVDGNVSGGTVRLKAKEYYPETTIFLKRGVTLRGARKSHKHSTSTSDASGHRQTTILTSGLERGATAYTWHHFNESEDREHFDANAWGSADYTERSHPHFPLIAGYDRLPIERDRERTEYERLHRAHGVGLEGVHLHADETRWWDFDEHGASDHWTEREHATYFGVFDGYLFEGLNYVHVEDVEVTGFDGYGGFYGDVNNVVSRGNFYSAGSTDYHGSALSLSTAGLEPGGTHGVWDVRVRAPTPAVELSGGAPRAKFVSGAWSRAKIDGRGPSFLGDESTFDDDEHPIGPASKYKHACVFQTDGAALIDGYMIGKDGGGVGLDADAGDVTIANSRISGDYAAIRVGATNVVGHNLRLGGGEACLECAGAQGSWANSTLSGPTVVLLHPGAKSEGGFDHVDFGGSTALATTRAGSGEYRRFDEIVALNHPDLRTVSELVADRPAFADRLSVATPIGYRNAQLHAVGGWTADDDGNAVEAPITGDGGAEYAVAHDLDEVPVHVTTLARNEVAQERWPVTWSADETEIMFGFAEGLPDGEEAKLSWTAFGWTHPAHNVQV